MEVTPFIFVKKKSEFVDSGFVLASDGLVKSELDFIFISIFILKKLKTKIQNLI